MVRAELRDFSADSWHGVVSDFPNFTLAQTWEYAQAKVLTGSWKARRLVFIEGSRIVAAAQAIVRLVPKFDKGLVWINGGPLGEFSSANDALFLSVMEKLKGYWVDQKRMYLRLALPWPAQEVDFSKLRSLGYESTDCSGWASIRLDLSLPLDQLRSQLQQKWRNCLNKSERLGIEEHIGFDPATMSAFAEKHQRMLEERKFDTTITPDLIATLQGMLPSDRKLLVFLGKHNGQAVGGVLIARYGKICEYLAGVMDNAGRSVNVGHFLLWRAICEMKNRGYRWFDLGGADTERSPAGILHFKMGCGGTAYRFANELEACSGAVLSRLVRWQVRRARSKAGGPSA